MVSAPFTYPEMDMKVTQLNPVAMASLAPSERPLAQDRVPPQTTPGTCDSSGSPFFCRSWM